ncbi:MAG: sugar ABC transporter permease [Propionicimonas sp.]|uniref:carbohydrate ABC transporter permease n=1 Tax=Propionicimonas sp. TaxID=1955623 RepID=UPI002B20CE94|nr:sugar ABC transporter permease [Propionicimonas sp.]MEA4945720.1 sugar ABC transporter permease [Propionicimonas sp.]
MDFLLHPDDTAGKLLGMLVAIMAFVAVVGLILLLLRLPKRLPRWVTVLGMLAPALVAMAFGLVYPALVTIDSSFRDRQGTQWVGLANYVQAFTEGQFLIVLRNTVLWVVLVPLLATGVGLLYAALVDRTRFEKLAKTMVFLPMAISMVGASIIWKFVYDNKVGLLSEVYVQFARLFGATDPTAPQWLLNSPWNNFFLIIVMVWIQAGFAMTVLSAAIKAIPDDIIEAARLDGLGGARMFRYITVPMIRPSLVVVLTTVAMASLKAFDVVRTMTGGNYDTSVVANEFYTQSFTNQNRGLGSALAVLLFIIIIPVIAYNVRQLKMSEDVR